PLMLVTIAALPLGNEDEKSVATTSTANHGGIKHGAIRPGVNPMAALGLGQVQYWKGRAGRCRAFARLLAAALEHLAAFVGQLAAQAVGLQWIGEPGLGPAVLDAEAHGAGADLLAPFVEQGEFAAGLFQTARQPCDLDRMGMVVACRDCQSPCHRRP